MSSFPLPPLKHDFRPANLIQLSTLIVWVCPDADRCAQNASAMLYYVTGDLVGCERYFKDKWLPAPQSIVRHKCKLNGLNI